MRNLFVWLLLLAAGTLNAQELTVPMIMRDPKWIGTSPSGEFWSPDSKELYFDWNPDGAPSDSTYLVGLTGTNPAKMNFLAASRREAESRGSYNRSRTLMVYGYENDLYLLDFKLDKTYRITRTNEFKFNPVFARGDTWIVYRSGDNLFAWERASGATYQLTDFRRNNADAPPAPMGPGRGGRRGGASAEGAPTDPQGEWLDRQQRQLMDVLKDRKAKRDAREAYLKAEKNTDTLKVINIGERSVQNLTLSPDGRYVTYALYQAPTGSKNTIVPNYVTESGFTTDIPGRTKVGAPQGKYTLYVYDLTRDTVMEVKTDSIPGITDEPDYVKDYPSRKSARVRLRDVSFGPAIWNDEGTRAVVDVRSHDYKDRWIMEIHTGTGTLGLVDRQRDEAWVGGPGIERTELGWLNGHTCWFESETTGYAHLYTYDLEEGKKTALTSGNYEVQRAILSHDKKYFYLLTNEEHPGKQNWYRLSLAPGSRAEKITSLSGMYEVSLSPDQHWIAYLYNYINKPSELYIQENLPGKTPIQVTNKAMSAEFKAYPWRDTRIFTFTARDGKPVYARVYDPAPGKKNGAAVIFVHGAGYLQNVDYGWSEHYFREYMFNNLLADKGYTVLDIDYRGSAGYGRDWRTGIYRHMGGKDLDDEVDAARYMVANMGIDSARIGLYGGSYGGFMTQMAMFTAPSVFHSGAALRSVTDWAHYNHGYTAEILNEPFNDSLAYARSSPINFASGLQGNLLICHGMVDVNVNFQDDVRLVQRLIELGKDNWQIAIYPVEDHGFVEPSSWTDEYKRILHLFDTTLLK